LLTQSGNTESETGVCSCVCYTNRDTVV